MPNRAEDHEEGNIGSAWRFVLPAASWSVFVAVNFVITMASVLAPYDTGVPAMADGYKLASLVVGILAAIAVARMKRTYLLVPLALLQMACFLSFASHLNTLCCATAQGPLL